MKNISLNKISLVLLTLLISAATLFSAPRLPIVEILGSRYYVYETKKDDTLFGIARQYGWDDSELKRLNPNALSPLKKGTKVYYPVKYMANRADKDTVSDLTAYEAQPVMHLIKRGETVYSIARMYDMPVDAIYKLNPGSKTGIREGELLKIKDSETQPAGENPEFYTIKSGNTLYSVAKEFGTTVAALMKLNPGISERNFKAGDIIRIPERGTGVNTITTKVEESTIESFATYEVKKNDTWESISEKTGVDKEKLVEANSGAKLKAKEIIGVPEIAVTTVDRQITDHDPREETPEGRRDIYEDTHDIASAEEADSVRMAIVLYEPSTRKDQEFSRGFLTGVDKLKRGNTHIAVKIIDGTEASSDVIEGLGDFRPDMIFITSDKNIPSYLSDYATVHAVTVVNVFDIKSEEYTSNPYFIQLLTPSTYFNDEIAAWLGSEKKDATLIFAGTVEENDQLAQALRQIWPKEDVQHKFDTDGLKDITYWNSDKYIIYGSDTKKSDVAKLLETVKEIRNDNPGVDITLVGRPNWIVFDEQLGDELHQADALIPSRFYYDKESYDGRRFAAEYKRVFDMTPVKSFPNYAALGFDVCTYFIPEMARTGGDLNALRSSLSGAQSEFALTRPSNWSGFYNPVVYMVRFTPYGSIEKIKVMP